MVVTPGAGDGQPQQPPRRHVDAVVRDQFGVVAEPVAQREEPHRRERRVVRGEARLIRGELLRDEPVERLVRVEAAGDVVPVGPGEGVIDRLPEDVALRVRVAGDVQPVPRPPRAVPRVGEHAIHQPRPPVRRLVRQRRPQFVPTRRQAQQIEIEPPHLRAPLRRPRGVQTGAGQPGVEEPVDRRGARRVRHGGAADRPERPVLGRVGVLLFYCASGEGLLRPDGAAVDPGAQQGDPVVRQLAGGGHAGVVVGVGQRLDQATAGRVPRGDRGGSRAERFRRQRRRPAVQPHAALLLVGAVTREAVRGQQRPDARLEVGDFGVVRSDRGRPGGAECGRGEERTTEARGGHGAVRGTGRAGDAILRATAGRRTGANGRRTFRAARQTSPERAFWSCAANACFSPLPLGEGPGVRAERRGRDQSAQVARTLPLTPSPSPQRGRGERRRSSPFRRATPESASSGPRAQRAGF